ncbi:hypothetical protein ZWY2020_013805 [Hordeum vulgare]|nr:hypothetical protein ZWY2020_013805 [Hordeum vulgare]
MSGVASSSGAAAGGLPLIQCPDCKIRKIRRFESTTENHPGCILYKWKNPCNFWQWQYSYIDYVKLHGHLSGESLDSKVLERKTKKNKAQMEPEDMLKMTMLLKSLPRDFVVGNMP